MMNKRFMGVVLAGVLLLNLVLPVMALAADTPPGWHVVAAGGAVGLENSQYRLDASVGQVGVVGTGNNGIYVLASGYWAGGIRGLRYTVYLPLLLKM